MNTESIKKQTFIYLRPKLGILMFPLRRTSLNKDSIYFLIRLLLTEFISSFQPTIFETQGKLIDVFYKKRDMIIPTQTRIFKLLYNNIYFMNCIAQIYKQLPMILSYSGRGFMKIGSYGNCVQLNSTDYKLIRYCPNQQPQTNIYTGLCLPNECKGNQLKIIADWFLKNKKIPIIITQIQENIQNQQTTYSFNFLLTILIITTFFCLCILSTCFKSLQSHHFLSVFSVRNSIKMFESKSNNLNILNGIRSLAMLWVIFGHQYSLVLAQVSNIYGLQKIVQTSYFLLIQAGLFAVDTFFFIGGFLLAYSVLKQKNTPLSFYPIAILNRLIRFLPSYLLALLIYSAILPHMGSGPLWKINMLPTQFCKQLWKPLLYLDNIIDNGSEMCMSWGWYLQNDMQLFIYCIIILIVYKRSKIASYLIIWLSLTASWAYSMFYTYQNKVHNIFQLSDEATWGNYFTDVYIKPWTRSPPYLYGLFFGISYFQFICYERQKKNINFLSHLKQRFKNHPNQRRLWEISGIFFGSFLVFIPKTAQIGQSWSQFLHSIYITYSKTLFVVALSIIMLPSLVGIKQSMFKFIMDTKFFNWIAKISFWTYLIHLTIIYHWFGSFKTDQYFALIPTYSLFVAHTILSMLIGSIFVFLVQIPCYQIQKKLLKYLKFIFIKQKNADQMNEVQYSSSKKIQQL